MDERDVFISYTQKDKVWALWIADVLKRHHYSVYLQAQDSTPGVNFVEFMERASENSPCLISVWFRAYSESDFCKMELRSAVANLTKFIIIRVHEDDVPKYYKQFVYLNIFKYDNEDEALSELLKAVGYTGKLDVRTPFPNPYMSINPATIANAFFELGTLYLDNSVVQNSQRAYDYLKLASDFHHAEASRMMGEFYDGTILNPDETPVVPEDSRKALDYYRLAVRYGDTESLNKIGEFYFRGDGLPSADCEKACHYFEQAINKDSTNAKMNLASVYLYGPPDYRNKQRAWVLLYEAATSARNEEAATEINVLLNIDASYFREHYPCGSAIHGTIQKPLDGFHILRIKEEAEIKFIRVQFLSKGWRSTRQYSSGVPISAKISKYYIDDEEKPEEERKLIVVLEAVP